MCLLWRHVYLGLLPIFSLHFLFMVLLSCMSCLHILEIKPLSVASFADPSSQPVRCLFIFCMASFAVQTLVSLMRSHLLIFAFISIPLGDWPKKTLAWFMLEIYALPMFSSRSFTVSCLIFKTLSHFQGECVQGVRVCSNFTELHEAVQLLPTLLAEESPEKSNILGIHFVSLNWQNYSNKKKYEI